MTLIKRITVLALLLCMILPVSATTYTPEVTRDNILAFLDKHDPDGAFIFRQNESGTLTQVDNAAGTFTAQDFMIYWETSNSINGVSQKPAFYSPFKLAVHEECHHISLFPGGERIYVGDGEFIEVTVTASVDVREIIPIIPDYAKSYYYDMYLGMYGADTYASYYGAYGLLQEWMAHCWSTNNEMKLLNQRAHNAELYDIMPTTSYLAYAEFRYWTLVYLDYVRTNYPEVYSEVMSNKGYKEAFTKIDERYNQVVLDYFEALDALRQDMTLPQNVRTFMITGRQKLPGLATYERLMEEMEKTVYQEILRELKT